MANKVGLKYISQRHWLLFVLEILFAFISGFSAYMTSWMTKSFTNTIISSGSLVDAMIIVVFVTVYIFVRNVLQNLTRVYSKYVFSKTRKICKIAFVEHIKKINLSFFDIPENKSIFARAEQYALSGTEQIVTHFFYCFSNIIACASILLLLSPFSWWIVVVLIILMSYKVVIDGIIATRDYKYRREKVNRDRKEGYFGNVFKGMGALVDFHMYGAHNLFIKHYETASEENISYQVKHDRFNSFLTITSFVTLIAQNIVLYWYAGAALLAGDITIGDFTMFFTATNYLNMILINIKNSITPIMPMLLESQNYYEFLNIDDRFKFVKPTDKNIAIESIDKIEFRDVTFKYPEKENFVLKNVSFTISKGECVSFVGLNGSGKTTIIKLLLRLYDPNQGEILINDIPIRDLDLKNYWKLFSTVFQDFATYAVSILENVSMTETNSTDAERVEDEINRNGLAQRVAREANGLHTALSRDFDPTGTLFSGGERQRVAFCRAHYKDSQVYILDEPSSALDATAEQDLFNFIKSIASSNDHIVIFVSHRLSTSTIADNIIYIEQSNVKCSGNHDYMMANCKKYAELYTLQAEKYRK